MPNTTTLNETLRSPVDGTEFVRLATPGANWKAKITAVVGSTPIVGGVAGGILYDGGPGILQESSNLTFNGTNTINLNGGVSEINLPAISCYFDGGAGNTSVTGTNNFGTGAGALAGVSTGANNTAIGVNALGSGALTGQNNTAIGFNALNLASGAIGNVAIGDHALAQLTNGQSNFGIGSFALNSITTQSQNTAVGPGAGQQLTDTACVFIGYHAGGSQTTGTGNTGVGNQSLQGSGAVGSFNTAIGYLSGGVITGQENTCVGSAAGAAISAGGNNTMVGFNAGHSITTGSSNVVLGAHGASAAVNNCILFSDGGGTLDLDYNFTNSNLWTLASGIVTKNYTVATLPGVVTGTVAYVTDGDAGLAWGATAVNSGAGATKYLVWYNGANWTVVGK